MLPNMHGFSQMAISASMTTYSFSQVANPTPTSSTKLSSEWYGTEERPLDYRFQLLVCKGVAQARYGPTSVKVSARKENVSRILRVSHEPPRSRE